MTTGPTSTPTAGGCLLAVAIIAGAAGGFYFGQPSIGLLAGGVAGIAIAGLVWVRDRRR